MHGIELSPHHGRPAAGEARGQDVPVVGNMATTGVAGSSRLVYVVLNTIPNLTTQEEQVAVFANAAAHLVRGAVRCRGVRATAAPAADQRARSRLHARRGPRRRRDVRRSRRPDPLVTPLDGRRRTDVRHSAPYRYIWPAELDLMARLAGLRFGERWASWTRDPFTSASENQVAVFEKR